MTYYKTWQEALMDYVRQHGKDYEEETELFALMTEFEAHLQKNTRGAYYIREAV